jgi:hypothetical protein
MIKDGLKFKKLPFQMGPLKDFRDKPKIVDYKKPLYVALELAIGSAMEFQKIPSKDLPKGFARDIKSGLKLNLKVGK